MGAALGAAVPGFLTEFLFSKYFLVGNLLFWQIWKYVIRVWKSEILQNQLHIS